MMWISLASPIWAKSGSWDMASIWTGYVGITGIFTIRRANLSSRDYSLRS